MSDTPRPARYAVLIVEEEPLLRMDAMDLAEEAGLRAHGAGDADEAVMLLERHDDIRILFADTRARGSMDGLGLARAVRGRWPLVRIVMTSGIARPTAAQMPENGVFLAKPYPPRFLLQTMREIAAGITA